MLYNLHIGERFDRRNIEVKYVCNVIPLPNFAALCTQEDFNYIFGLCDPLCNIWERICNVYKLQRICKIMLPYALAV